MKKVKYSEGLIKRAVRRNFDPGTLKPSFEDARIRPVKVDNKIIAEQVAASMAIEDRVIPAEDIVVQSTEESRKAVADVLSIRVRDRERRLPPDF